MTKPSGTHGKTKGHSLNYFVSILAQRGSGLVMDICFCLVDHFLSRLFSLEPYGWLLDLVVVCPPPPPPLDFWMFLFSAFKLNYL